MNLNFTSRPTLSVFRLLTRAFSLVVPFHPSASLRCYDALLSHAVAISPDIGYLFPVPASLCQKTSILRGLRGKLTDAIIVYCGQCQTDHCQILYSNSILVLYILPVLCSSSFTSYNLRLRRSLPTKASSPQSINRDTDFHYPVHNPHLHTRQVLNDPICSRTFHLAPLMRR